MYTCTPAHVRIYVQTCVHVCIYIIVYLLVVWSAELYCSTDIRRHANIHNTRMYMHVRMVVYGCIAIRLPQFL